jgi:hypothetical protein
MKIWKLALMVMMVVLTMTCASLGFGAVSPEEAAKLGTTLNGVGAEMAGNREGTIPAYTGGLTKPPANFKPGSGMRPDPFAAEKPLFSIDAQNMSRYADKLTDGTRALMKRISTFHIDVYKTHRTVAYPENVLKNTAKNAVKATTYNDGLSLKGAHGGYPFPIPNDGCEAMWNHQVRFLGRATETQYTSWLVDYSGKLLLLEQVSQWNEWPYYDEDQKRYDSNLYYKVRNLWRAPRQKAGEIAVYLNPLNMHEKGRVTYLYLPGQQRVKLGPEIAFDNGTGGTVSNYVVYEISVFTGSMERYHWRLIGKKEFYVPYNAYRAVYTSKKEDLYGPKHLNPDRVRWELHRMWVVEATLRPGERHIYPRRTFYIDEDSWAALAGENYDASGNIYMVNFVYQAPSYDVPAPNASFTTAYNFSNGSYSGNVWLGEGGYQRQGKVAPERDWTPAGIASIGIRSEKTAFIPDTGFKPAGNESKKEETLPSWLGIEAGSSLAKLVKLVAILGVIAIIGIGVRRYYWRRWTR